MPGVLDALLEGAYRRDTPADAAFEKLHPRDLIGQFRKKVAALAPGDVASLPDGIYVTRLMVEGKPTGTYEAVRTVQPKGGVGAIEQRRIGSGNAGGAAELALRASAQSTHPKSLGGATSYGSPQSAVDAAGGFTVQPAQQFTPSSRALVGHVERRIFLVVDARGRTVARHNRKRDAVADMAARNGPKARESVIGGLLDRARLEGEPVEEAVHAPRRAASWLFRESKVKRRSSGPGHSGGEFSHTAGGSRPLTQPFATMKPRGLKTTTHAGGGVTKLSTVSKPAAPGARADEPSHRKPKLTEDELAAAVGAGEWTQQAEIAAKALKEGTVEDSEVFHRSGQGTGYWSSDRIALHNRIYSLLLQGAGHHPEDAEATFLAGGPASGKSSLEKSGRTAAPGDAVIANADVIKELLPEYRALKKAGDPQASSKVHEESSYIAKQLTALAIQRKHHVVVDGVGDSEPGKFVGKIKQAQTAGHRVRVIYATTDVEAAVERSARRGKRTGRNVPEGYLRSAHRDVTRRFVDDILPDKSVPVEIWDTTNGLKLVARRVTGGGLVTEDRKLWAAWLRKGKTGQLQQAA